MPAVHKIMFLESGLLTAAVCVLSMLVGLVAGGAIYSVAWRMTHGRSVFGPSRCPHCGHVLSKSETIPVISWIAQRGSCNYCKQPLSMAYPSVELLGAGMFASVILRYGMSAQGLEVLAFTCVLLAVSLTSLFDYSIPNSLLVVAVVVRVGYLLALVMGGEEVVDLLLSSVVGVVALGLPLAASVFLSNALLMRDVTGMGTVKLVAVVGFYLGWQQGLLALAVATAVYLVIWLLSPSKLMPVEVSGGATELLDEEGRPVAQPLATDMRATMEEDIAEPMRLIPFAPAIALCCWGMLLLGASVATWNMPLF